MKNVTIAAALCLVAVLAVGCGEGGVDDAAAKYEATAAEGAKAAKNLAEQGEAIGAEWMADAEAMIAKLPEAMQAKAGEVKDQIAAQQDKLGEIKSQISELSPKDAMSDKGKQLKAQAEELASKLAELKDELKSMLSQVGQG